MSDVGGPAQAGGPPDGDVDGDHPTELRQYKSNTPPRTGSTYPPTEFRRRAGTWGGNTAVSRDKVEDSPEWKVKLLEEKKKFSRTNKWGKCSYKALIIEAIEQSPQRKMTLNEIYDWIVQNIDFFKGEGATNSSAGWKNSIRHNLSLHAIFVKEPQQNGTRSIGCYWRLDRSREPDKEKSRKRQREGTIRRRANTDQPEARNEALRRKTKSDKLQSPCRKMSSPCGLGTSSHLASSVSSLNRDSLEHSPSHSLPDSGFSPTGSSQSSLSNSIDFSPTLKNEHSSFSTDVALGLEVDSKPYLSHESVATPKPVIKVEANSDERSQELIDVRVNVPYHQYKLYKSKNYTFWLMPKNMIGQPQFNRAILVQNPNPMEVEQFKTPEAPIKKENQKSLRNFLNDHEKNFSQLSIEDQCDLDDIYSFNRWEDSDLFDLSQPNDGIF